MNKDIKIVGKKVYLRAIRKEDTEEILKIRNSKSVVENFIYRKPISYEEHINWLKNKVDMGKVDQFVVCDINTEKILGSVYLQNFEDDTLIAESGIFLSSECVGNGIGTEAYKLLISYCFEILNLHKVKARVLAYNKASMRLHEKLGYNKEAYFQEELLINGEYEDEIFYGILNKRRKK